MIKTTGLRRRIEWPKNNKPQGKPKNGGQPNNKKNNNKNKAKTPNTDTNKNENA